MIITHHKILEIDKNASDDDIKKSYRKLAKRYHPDVNKESNAENKFKEISEAYDTLGDENKRRQYDNQKNNPFGGFGGFNFQKRETHMDINIKIPLTYEEIFNGCIKNIKYI